MFSGHVNLDAIWNIPYSLDPNGFIEHGVTAHIWCPHFLHGKLPNFFECPMSTLLEAYAMDALVNVDGVFSHHRLSDGRMVLLLLAILLCGRQLPEYLKVTIHVLKTAYHLVFIRYWTMKRLREQNSRLR